MKSLLDIQQEVRGLEGTLKEMTHTIQSINEDIQNLREEKELIEIDYEAVSLFAKYIPFSTHPIKQLKDTYMCKLYLETLIKIVQISSENMIDKLIFIQWILEKSGEDISLEQLYIASVQFDKADLFEMATKLSEDYKMYLVIDALIVANINGKADEATFSFIADLCSIFGMDKEQVGVYSEISKVVLCQKIGEISHQALIEIARNHYKLEYYLYDVLVNASPRFLKQYKVLQLSMGKKQ